MKLTHITTTSYAPLANKNSIRRERAMEFLMQGFGLFALVLISITMAACKPSTPQGVKAEVERFRQEVAHIDAEAAAKKKEAERLHKVAKTQAEVDAEVAAEKAAAAAAAGNKTAGN